jgi:CRISPR-associated exonuclease Cas4
MNDFINGITGTEVNYYFVCKRKLWYFTHGITMEQNSEYVELGKIIHEESYKREKKEILIDGTIKLDFIDKEMTIHETKKSKSMSEATKYQLLYYLKLKGVSEVKGIVHYPKSRRKEKVELNENDEKILKEVFQNIINIKSEVNPPKLIESSICKKCSYYDLCYC